MSDLTPYEKDLAKRLNNLPLPDEDQAWKEMKAMLDDGNDRGGGAIGGKPSGSPRAFLWGSLIILAIIGVVFWRICAHKDQPGKTMNGTDTTTGNSQPANSTGTNGSDETVKNQQQIDHINGDRAAAIAPADSIRQAGSTTDSNNSATNGSPIKKPGDPTASNHTTATTNPNKQIPAANSDNGINEKGNAPGATIEKSHQDLSANTNTPPSSSTNDIVNSGTGSNRHRHIHHSHTTANSSPSADAPDNSASTILGSDAKHSTTRSTAHTTHRLLHSIAHSGINSRYRSTPSANGATTYHKPHSRSHSVTSRGRISRHHVTNADVSDGGDLSTTTGDVPPPSVIIDTAKHSFPKTFPKAADTTKDTVTVKTDSIIVKDKAEVKEKHHATLSAGIAVQQTLNGSCNCAYPYNVSAPAIVKDYIPSVYIRFNQPKWFLQGEFKYAAPQYTEGITYHITENIPVVLNDTATSFTLKKIYGHQGMLSFNYLVLPNFSIGAGLIYNIFTGADIEKAVQKKTIGGDSVISTSLITDKQDTGFTGLAKNNFQLMLEAQYQWKRFSFGARYAFGITPYLDYSQLYFSPTPGSSPIFGVNAPGTTLPGPKKNNSFNIFVRFELWKQK